MARTILVAGFGPGISTAVAERFGAEGFDVAIVARNADRIGAGVAALKAKGIRVEGFIADLSKPDAIRAMIAKVRDSFGSISVLQWSAYKAGVPDLLAASPEDIRGMFDVAVAGLVTTVQELLPDLRAEKGAVLVSNGGLGFFDDKVDAIAVTYGAMGLSVANSAKHKTIRLLSKKLAPEGVYVGEIMVTGTVKHSAFDRGNATLEPTTIAARFWDMYQARKDVSVVV
jgi:NADP-dependent 3-hydroxy acid dehydrogenase YdfG